MSHHLTVELDASIVKDELRRAADAVQGAVDLIEQARREGEERGRREEREAIFQHFDALADRDLEKADALRKSGEWRSEDGYKRYSQHQAALDGWSLALFEIEHYAEHGTWPEAGEEKRET